MNFQFYFEKLTASDVFKNFMKENPGAFLCSGFFIIDREGDDNKQHFDYYLPSEKKIFSFKLEEEIQRIPIDLIDERIPEKISADYDFDFNDVEKMIINEMKEKVIGKKIQKIILSLQRLEGKDFLVGTVFISGLGLIKIHIDISEMKIVLFEKKSFFDMVRGAG